MMAQKYSVEKVAVGLPGYKEPRDRRCRECGCTMRAEIEWRDAEPGEEGIRRYIRPEIPVRVKYYGYGREGFFCSLKCAYRFACKVCATTMHARITE